MGISFLSQTVNSFCRNYWGSSSFPYLRDDDSNLSYKWKKYRKSGFVTSTWTLCLRCREQAKLLIGKKEQFEPHCIYKTELGSQHNSPVCTIQFQRGIRIKPPPKTSSFQKRLHVTDTHHLRYFRYWVNFPIGWFTSN